MCVPIRTETYFVQSKLLGLERCKSTDGAIFTQNGTIPQESSILSNPVCSGAGISACSVSLEAFPQGNKKVHIKVSKSHLEIDTFLGQNESDWQAWEFGCELPAEDKVPYADVFPREGVCDVRKAEYVQFD